MTHPGSGSRRGDTRQLAGAQETDRETGGGDGNRRTGARSRRDGGQYSLATILGIWALAAVPMGVLSWVVFPAVSPDVNADPLGAAVTRMALLTPGLILLFVLSPLIVR